MQTNRSSFLMVGVALLALGALLLPVSAEAQGSGRSVGIGGKAAWNLSRIRGEALADNELPIDFNTGNGFSIGALLAIDAHPNITIQPEFLYSQKKVKADVPFEDVTAAGEIDTDWFEIPVLAKLHGSNARGARPFALVGGTFSFLVNAEQTLTLGDDTETQDIKDELTGSDVGITFGGGVDFVQDWGVFTVDARYTFGLRQLSDGDSVKQDTFAIGGGVIF